MAMFLAESSLWRWRDPIGLILGGLIIAYFTRYGIFIAILASPESCSAIPSAQADFGRHGQPVHPGPGGHAAGRALPPFWLPMEPSRRCVLRNSDMEYPKENNMEVIKIEMSPGSSKLASSKRKLRGLIFPSRAVNSLPGRPSGSGKTPFYS